MQPVLEKNTLVQYEAKNQGNDKETANKNKKKSELLFETDNLCQNIFSILSYLGRYLFQLTCNCEISIDWKIS